MLLSKRSKQHQAKTHIETGGSPENTKCCVCPLPLQKQSRTRALHASPLRIKQPWVLHKCVSAINQFCAFVGISQVPK